MQVQLLIRLSEVCKEASLKRKQAFYLYLASSKAALENEIRQPNYKLAQVLVDAANKMHGQGTELTFKRNGCDKVEDPNSI